MDKTRMSEILRDASSSPGDFLRRCMKANKITKADLAKMLDCSRAYIDMVLSNYTVPEKKAVLRISLAVGIDPVIYYRMCSDYKMKQYLDSMEFKTFYKEMEKSPETSALMKDLYCMVKKIWIAGRDSVK